MSDRRAEQDTSLEASVEAHNALASHEVDPLLAVVDAFVEAIRTGARSCCSAMVGAPPKRSMSQPSSSAASLGPGESGVARPRMDDGLGSVLTALSNDYAYAEVMARQVKALAHPGDVVVGMSTSGRSSNVVNGLTAARSLNEDGCVHWRRAGPLAEVDVVFAAPAPTTRGFRSCTCPHGTPSAMRSSRSWRWIRPSRRDPCPSCRSHPRSSGWSPRLRGCRTTPSSHGATALKLHAMP